MSRPQYTISDGVSEWPTTPEVSGWLRTLLSQTEHQFRIVKHTCLRLPFLVPGRFHPLLSRKSGGDCKGLCFCSLSVLYSMSRYWLLNLWAAMIQWEKKGGADSIIAKDIYQNFEFLKWSLVLTCPSVTTTKALSFYYFRMSRIVESVLWLVICPRVDRRQQHNVIEQRRRNKTRNLLIQLQSLLVRYLY